MCCGVYSIPPQGPAFWDPKSEGSEGSYFPCTGNFVFLCTGALFSLYWSLIFLYWGLCIFPVLGPYFPCAGDFMYGTGMKMVKKFWKFSKVAKGLIVSKRRALGGYTVETLSFFKVPMCVVQCCDV